ncbi:aconitate hydratase [Rhizophlyctis rosea]|uniref:Large ribosomal subunit protein bL21m n=1 Tax=Rhizophlyctis rosea TaxID=64517 RepID=A0AAD5SPE8_9FUNG|nr:aconitate hydratase [Rhizophlyctis rosea]
MPEPGETDEVKIDGGHPPTPSLPPKEVHTRQSRRGLDPSIWTYGSTRHTMMADLEKRKAALAYSEDSIQHTYSHAPPPSSTPSPLRRNLSSVPTTSSYSPSPQTPWSLQTTEALTHLRNSKSHWAIVELHSQPYYVHLHDTIVFHRMKQFQLGDIISLDRVREIGSEDYILQGRPYVDPSYFTIKCVVVEHAVAEETTNIFRKRNAKDKITRNHNHHTLLRVIEIGINKPQGQ